MRWASLLASFTVFSLFSATAAHAAAAPAKIPVNAFFSYDKVSDAKISPDGKHLAIVVADDADGANRKYLAILDATDHKETAGFQVADGDAVLDFWWANDERVLIATATDTGSFERPSADGGLYAINVDKSQPLQLLGYFPPDKSKKPKDQKKSYYFNRILYLPHPDTHHILVQVATYDYADRAMDVDIYSGEVKEIVKSPTVGGSFIADSKGQIRVATGWSNEGHRRCFYRDSADAQWKEISSLYQGGDPAEDGSGPSAFMPDDKRLYWWGRTTAGTMGLYSLDPADTELKLLYGDPDVDVSYVYFDEIAPNSYEAYAVETMPGLPVSHVLDAQDWRAKVMASLSQAFPAQKVYITSTTRDNSQMIVFVTSDRDPGDYYQLDAKTLKADYLFSSREDIDPSLMAARQPVQIKARDGLMLHGYLTVPAGSSGKALPMVLLPHGGPHGIRDEWSWDSEAEYFAYHGYAVLQVNYRGSGGYGMKFQDLGYRHWGTTMQDDLADSVQWAVSQGIADSKRVCIYGASYGGYAALENPIRYPNLYRCAIGYVGVYDLTLQAKHGDTHQSVSGRNFLEVVHGHDEDELEKYSPAYNAESISLPVLLIYGGKDMRVVPDNAKELMRAMDKAGKPYESIFEPYEAHGFSKPEHRFEVYNAMLAFLDKYIGPDAGKSATPAASTAPGH